MNLFGGHSNKKSAVSHWKLQRRSALVLVPLSIWLLFSLIHNIGAPYEQAHAWVANPIVALLLAIFIIALFYHAKLGLQVIIEDYISDVSGCRAILRISNLLCWIAMFIGVVSVLKVVLLT